MTNTWFVSDTHFGHENALRWRPRFSSAGEMNQLMYERWCSVVKTHDIVYHLGDVAWGETALMEWLPRLPGRKRLCVGNHDNLKLATFGQHFQRIGLWHVFEEHGFVTTHVPLGREQLRRGCWASVHGHTHDTHPSGSHFVNVCVEHTDYTPIHLDEVVARVALMRDKT